MTEQTQSPPGCSPRRGTLLAWLAILALVAGCPPGKTVREGGSGRPPIRPSIDPARIPSVASTIPLPQGQPVLDPETGVQVPVPDGWAAYTLEDDPTLIVRLERAVPPAMRIEVHRGSDRVPNGNERFFDRGPYLGNGRSDDVVGVWADRDPARPGTWLFGVLIQRNGRSAVVEGWLPDEDFEAAKRSFDALVEATGFVEGEAP